MAYLAGVLLLCLLAYPSHAQPRKKNSSVPPPVTEDSPERGEQVLSLETNQVILNVTVTDSREDYVPGLTTRNFKVFEDRVEQKIIAFGFEETPFAAAILLDTSGSMETKMSLARSACSRFAAGIREGDTVAIYKFGGYKVKKLQEFTEVRDVDPIVWDTDADGQTPLYDAIVTAAEALASRPEKRRAILLISDGADTVSKASFEQAIRAAGAAHATIYSVDLSDAALSRGASRDPGSQILKEFSARTGGRFFATPGGGKLRDAFEQTVEELRHQYTIVYEPSNEKRDGKWRSLEVTVDSPLYKTRTRQGYYAQRVEPKQQQ